MRQVLLEWTDKISAGGMKMKQNRMQMLVSLLMGVLMPALAMQLGQALVSARADVQTQPPEAFATGETVIHTVPPMYTVQIPLLQKNQTCSFQKYSA